MLHSNCQSGTTLTSLVKKEPYNSHNIEPFKHTTMELYDSSSNMENKNPQDSTYRPRTIYFGVLLILAGTVWLLHAFGIISHHTFDVLFSWQMVIILIGLYLLALRQLYVGGITTAIGACLLIFDVIHYKISIVNVVFPVILISIGVITLLRLFKR